jgi:hypothetical protein
MEGCCIQTSSSGLPHAAAASGRRGRGGGCVCVCVRIVCVYVSKLISLSHQSTDSGGGEWNSSIFTQHHFPKTYRYNKTSCHTISFSHKIIFTQHDFHTSTLSNISFTQSYSHLTSFSLNIISKHHHFQFLHNMISI